MTQSFSFGSEHLQSVPMKNESKNSDVSSRTDFFRHLQHQQQPQSYLSPQFLKPHRLVRDCNGCSARFKNISPFAPCHCVHTSGEEEYYVPQLRVSVTTTADQYEKGEVPSPRNIAKTITDTASTSRPTRYRPKSGAKKIVYTSNVYEYGDPQRDVEMESLERQRQLNETSSYVAPYPAIDSRNFRGKSYSMQSNDQSVTLPVFIPPQHQTIPRFAEDSDFHSLRNIKVSATPTTRKTRSCCCVA